MNSPLNQHTDPELLVRYLSGDANEREINEVQQWINADEQYKEYVDQMTLLWKASKDAKDFAAIDIKRDWEKVIDRIRDSDNITNITTHPKQKSTWYHLVKAAAVIIIAVGLYFALPIPTRKWAEPTKIVTVVSHSEVTLPDGSKVYLNKNSRLTYPDKLNGQTREVALEGEAFFEVTKDEARPFLIRSGQAITEVVGTSFNVNSADSGKVVVTVVTGKILLYDETNSAKKITMTPGEVGKFGKGRDLVKTTNRDSNFLSWKTGVLIFHNTKLSLVIKDLNRHYNQHLELASMALDNCTLTSTFQHQTIEEVLAEIRLVLPIQAQKIGNAIIITGKGCNQGQ
jgi:transmembrane sensor